MKSRIALGASLFVLALGVLLVVLSQEQIATAAELLQVSGELDSTALFSVEPVVARPSEGLAPIDEMEPMAPAEEFSEDWLADSADLEQVLPLNLPAVASMPPEAGTETMPQSSSPRPGWPRTTAETTLAPPVARPPTDGKWVDINLSRQTVTAYIGSTPIKTVLTSTGTRRYPTVVGTFRVWAKIRSQTMSGGSRRRGDYYRLPGVPHIMYFYRGYGLHGTYWHRNFGRRMSHGCVNLTLDDAAWFYQFGYVGMIVRSHY